jgi:hypothetical protein
MLAQKKGTCGLISICIVIEARATSAFIRTHCELGVVEKITVKCVPNNIGARKTLPYDQSRRDDEDETLRKPEYGKNLQK